jgi:ADP-ribose pyrophosphatase
MRRPIQLASEPVLQTHWIEVRKTRYRFEPEGRDVDYFITSAAEIAMAVPVTRRGTVILVEQHKLPVGMRSLEFPAGRIDGGSALAAAKRELLEETGFRSSRWSKLGVIFADTGRSRDRIHIFLCRAAVRDREPAPDPIERLCGIRIREVGRGELRSMVADGRIRSSATLAAFAMLMARGSV